MRVFNKTEKAAFKQRHPKLPIKYYTVVQNKKVIFENNSPKLCHNYIKTNNIKNATVTPVR